MATPPSAPSPVTFRPFVSWPGVWVCCREQKQFQPSERGVLPTKPEPHAPESLTVQKQLALGRPILKNNANNVKALSSSPCMEHKEHTVGHGRSPSLLRGDSLEDLLQDTSPHLPLLLPLVTPLTWHLGERCGWGLVGSWGGWEGLGMPGSLDQSPVLSPLCLTHF